MIFDDSIGANIIHTDARSNLFLSVSEISSSTHSAGFKSGEISSKAHTLFFVDRGECVFNGKEVDTSAIILLAPGTTAGYTVPESCSGLSLYRITFSGRIVHEIIAESELGEQVSISYVSDHNAAQKLLSGLFDDRALDRVDASLFAAGTLIKLFSLERTAEKRTYISSSPYTRIILDYIHKNYNQNITEKMLGGLVNLSTNYMHKVFLADMNTTPIHYLNAYRISVSKDLLRDTGLSISEVASEVGIAGSDYFCRVFRKYNDGISPSKFRKSVKNNTK